MSKYQKHPLKGSGKEIKFDNGGAVINLSIEEEDFQKIPIKTSKGGKQYRNFTVTPKRSYEEKGEPDEYGNTHWAYTLSNTDEPAPKRSGASKAKKEEGGFDDLDW